MRPRTSSLRKPLFKFPDILGFDFAAERLRRANRGFFSSPFVLFSRALVANPGSVGAVCPSSSRLARALAEQAPARGGKGLVLELGAGTGRVTAALLERGVDPDNLIVVERDKLLARHLKDRFMNVEVVHGDAVKICETCGARDRRVECVVSSLPLLSLPPAMVEALGESLRNLLGRDGFLVQYTYRLNNRPSPLDAYMERVSKRTVWGNIPPARVEVFKARM